MPRLLCFLLAAVACGLAADPPQVLLVAGRPSHGPGAHEFNAGLMLLDKCLQRTGAVRTTLVKGGWPADESVFAGARALVFYMDGGGGHPLIRPERLETIGRLMSRGVGLVCLHYAVETPRDRGGAELLDWLGGFYERPYSQNPHNDVEVTQAAPRHPISRGWKSFSGRDEWYYKIRFRPDDPRVTPILTAMLPKDAPSRETIAWATERADGGRAFGFTGGHFHSNWGWPDFRRMVLNAIVWSAGVEVPSSGVACDVSPQELAENLDDKPPRKAP